MPKGKCLVCGNNSAQHPETSFHRFPRDSERKKQWLLVFELEERDVKIKDPLICSNHFHPKDVIIVNMLDGTQSHRIKMRATPHLNPPIFVDSSSDSDSDSDSSSSPTSTCFQTPTRNVLSFNADLMAENLITSPHDDSDALNNQDLFDSNTAGPSGMKIPILTKGKTRDDTLFSSSTTTSLSPAKDVLVVDRPRGKKRKRAYVGDICTSDFSTPEKTHKNLQAIKSCVTAQKKTIHYLRQNVRRERKRKAFLANYAKNHLSAKNRKRL